MLDVLLKHPESEVLDFKRELALDRKGIVELAKDLGAMQVRGGHLVIGVAEREGLPEVVGIPEEQWRDLDEARLRAKVSKYLPEPLDLLVQQHDIDGRRVALVYVGPHPDGFAEFAADGAYEREAGGSVVVFRAGEVFTRRGSSSVRMTAREIADAVTIRNVTSPALAAPDLSDAANFAATVEQLLIQEGSSARLKLVIVRGAQELEAAVRGGDRPTALRLVDRVTDLVAIAIVEQNDLLLDQALEVLIDSYNIPTVGGEWLWWNITVRIRAAGALAVRLSHWAAIRPLLKQRPVQDRGFWGNWIRHASVMAARADLAAEAKLVDAVAQVAVSLPSLVPDGLTQPSQVRRSVCAWEFLSSLAAVAMQPGDPEDAFFPYFVYCGQDIWPAADRLVTDVSMRAAIIGSADDQALADALHVVCHRASRRAEVGVFFEGLGFGSAERFFVEHPPSDEAVARMRQF
jgi:hypothetical protein